jgi:hypothetical protein
MGITLTAKSARFKVATVASVCGGYRLPDGLPQGAIVRVLDFDHGFHTVEFENRQFKIFSGCANYLPPKFYDNENARAFFIRIRKLVPSGLFISMELKHIRLAIFDDRHKPRGELKVHQDAILNLGPDFADHVANQLHAISRR